MGVDRTKGGGPLWKSCGRSWKFVILVEVGTEYVRVYGSSWKLPRNMFVEAAINGSNGSFHFHRQWKLSCSSMEASITSMEVNLLPLTSIEIPWN